MTKPRIQYLEQIPKFMWGNKLPILRERESADDSRTTDTAAPAATLLVCTTFDDEDTDNKIFQDWKEKYNVLEKYVKSNTGCIPVCRYKTDDGFALGSWVQKQKEVYRTIKSCRSSAQWMTKPRIEYLEQISNWTWENQLPLLLGGKEFADDEDTRNNNRDLLMKEDTNSQSFKTWNCQYEALKEYFKSNKQLPSARYRNEEKDRFALGKWVTTQKTAYWNEIKVQSGRDRMTKPRAEKLESIPNWTWGTFHVVGNKAQHIITIVVCLNIVNKGVVMSCKSL